MDVILRDQAEKFASELAAQVTTLDDLNGLMRTMMKTALERMLNTEMDVHLGRRTLPIGMDSAGSASHTTVSTDRADPHKAGAFHHMSSAPSARQRLCPLILAAARRSWSGLCSFGNAGSVKPSQGAPT